MTRWLINEIKRERFTLAVVSDDDSVCQRELHGDHVTGGSYLIAEWKKNRWDMTWN